MSAAGSSLQCASRIAPVGQCLALWAAHRRGPLPWIVVQGREILGGHSQGSGRTCHLATEHGRSDAPAGYRVGHARRRRPPARRSRNAARPPARPPEPARPACRPPPLATHPAARAGGPAPAAAVRPASGSRPPPRWPSRPWERASHSHRGRLGRRESRCTPSGADSTTSTSTAWTNAL